MNNSNAKPHGNATSWSPTTRILFRLGFCYFVTYALCCGNATAICALPWIGIPVQTWLAWPFYHAAQWVGQHVFHLTGASAILHGGGSGDRALVWIATGIMLAVALISTLVWTLLEDVCKSFRRPESYPNLFFWFRFILRITLSVAMMIYGFAKLYPLQMGPPLLAVLNEPLGQTSPMTMLWTLIGLNPIYEMICGFAEISAGILIFFRRTALLGTLLTVFLTINIVLYNFFFDVPVKLYAAHLLLMALMLLVPDLRLLINLFFLHRPSRPASLWTKPALRYGLRAETLISAAFVVMVTGMQMVKLGKVFSAMRVSMAHPNALTGQWHVDTATLVSNGEPMPKSYLTGDGLPMTDIFFEPNGRVMLRDSDHVLWRAKATVDTTKKTLQLSVSFADRPVAYALAQTDASHLVLSPTGKDASVSPVLRLTRVLLPSQYPLLSRGFHLVSEWGYER